MDAFVRPVGEARVTAIVRHAMRVVEGRRFSAASNARQPRASDPV